MRIANAKHAVFVAALVLAVCSALNRDCRAGLVGYWSFDGNLNDSSGMGNDGTASSPTYVADRFGNPASAIQLAAASDEVTVGTNGRGATSFSYGGWIQTSQTHEIDPQASGGTHGTSGQKYAFGADNGGGSGNAGSGLSIGINGISVYEHASSYMPALAVFNPGDNTTVGSGWNHVMVVYDGDKQPAIYLNGARVHTGVRSPKTPLAPVEIGAGSYGFLGGIMDDVVSFNHALSTSQVQALAGGASPHSLGITVLNPSFEDAPYPGGVGYGDIAGWSDNAGGPEGVNPSSTASAPFLNGLPVPDGTHVGFIQSNGTISQTLAGLTPGQQYVIEYYQDERGSSTNPVAAGSVDVDGVNVVAGVEVTRTPQFRRVVSRPFTATSPTALLEMHNTGIQADNTLLLDAVSVRPVGAVLLQDNFDLPNNPATPHVPAGNYDVNAGLGPRQAGLFAGTGYVETAHSASGPGDLASQIDFADIPSAAPDALFLGADASLGASYTAVSPNRNFAFGSINIGRMTFEFDVDPFLPGSTSGDNWASFRFGDGTPVQYVAAAGDGFGILFREGGAFQAFDGNTSIASGTAFTGAGFHAIRIDVETYAFDGSPATILAFADGSVTPFLTFSKPGGFTDNFITLGGQSGAGQMLHGFDNLMVYTAAVPEPSTWLLLALGGLAFGLVGRRRRR